MYGRLEYGALTCAPRGVTEGYKPVRYITPIEPPSGYEVEYGWEETTDEIIQNYELVKHEPTPDEALDFLFGGES